MKKTLFAIAALLCSVQFVNAQTEKGIKNLSINVDYVHVSNTSESRLSPTVTDRQKTTSNVFNIGPSFGVFICDGYELGGSLSYGTNDYKIERTSGTTDVTKQNIEIYGASLFLRKYVLYKNQIGFRVGPYAGYRWGTSTNTQSVGAVEQKNNERSLNVGGALDIVYYPSKNLGLALNLINLGYVKYTSKGDLNTQYDNKDFYFRAVNSGLGVSVFFVLGAK